MRRAPATITAARRIDGGARGAVALEIGAGRAVEKLAAGGGGTGSVGRFHRAGIGGIDEGDPAIGIAHPGRGGQRLDDRTQGSGLGLQLLVMMGEVGEVALDAAHVGELEHRAAPDRPAFGGEVAAGRGGERDREALAAPEQPVDVGFQMQRLFGTQPGRKGQELVGREVGRDDRGVADDLRHGIVVPRHHHLRLRQQEVVEPVDLGGQRRHLGIGAGALGAEPFIGAHQQDGADHREEQHADEQGEPGQFVLVERLERLHIGEPERDRVAFRRGLAGEAHEYGAGAGNAVGSEHRASAPMRWHPHAARPDQVRHPLPLTPVLPFRRSRRTAIPDARRAFRLARASAPP